MWPRDLREAFKWAGGLIGAAATIIGALATLGILSGSSPEEALANAASETLDAGSSRVRVETRLAGPPGAERGVSTVVADGELDYTTGRGRFEYDLSTTNPPARWKIEVRFAGGALYARLPPEWGLSPARPWLRAELERLQRVGAQQADARVSLLARLSFEDVSGTLEYLEQAGDVEEVGSEEIRGVETTRYDATIDLSDADLNSGAAGGDSTVKVSAWIDDEETLRRMLLRLPDGSVADIELFEFGTRVEVSEPPASRVIELEELVQQLP
jgi:hypothetical protein